MFDVRSGRLLQLSDLHVVMVGFYGSESVPKVVSIRSDTFWGPVFGRVAQKNEAFLQICKISRFFHF